MAGPKRTPDGQGGKKQGLAPALSVLWRNSSTPKMEVLTGPAGTTVSITHAPFAAESVGSRFPAPIGSETSAMPTDHCPPLDDL